MDTSRPCGCKGCRTCLLCESTYGIQKSIDLNKDFGTYVYCPFCNKAWPGWNMDDYKSHPEHKGEPIEFPGVYINCEFLSNDEEKVLLDCVDSIPWDLSQSGRRKQNFGPKCNFKKKKLQLGQFRGFPSGTKFVQDKFKHEEIIADFHTIEQCSLEYDPARGASIDPHVDDCWIWGERIVTVNLLSDSVLTMTNNSKPNSYNLTDVNTYPSITLKDGKPFEFKDTNNKPVVRIPMPQRSLLVLYGSARYEWEHLVLREDILSRRICLAYREFTPPYLKEGSNYLKSESIFKQALNFF
ncbi:PREDICTED: alpha-ketoglutarate-dependent dioxygenase alkB homolog 4 [Nicrophorus vespilloides]|uniref:Alpha-ketoglutarate-dependent dioxygenase alkB homolog 4 n=1 Tax=Nicrophorus vespilloides TaxID=110193 RepID=A0ABM1MG47_NICVS|nr:PREDICTED: alpha-ketoglutarate-dependent dioxygenase alkB homolog 4 [Nicrophorus vespilloides]